MALDKRPHTGPTDIRQAAAERPDDVGIVLAELASLLVQDQTLESTLQRIIDVAVRVIPGCDAAGVTVTDGGVPRTAAYTDERTLKIDSDQYETGSGPCLEATRTGRVQRVDVEAAAQRWPAFSRAAREDGIRSFLAAPLVVGERILGALNLYSLRGGGFDALDEVFLRLFVGQASTAVANRLTYDEMRALARQLEEALSSRAVIDQAKGVLMCRYGINADAAFAVLRRHSQERNVKLRVIAQEIVDGCTAATGAQR